MAQPGNSPSAKELGARTLVQASVFAVVALLCIVGWLAFDFLLLMFAAILFGVLFSGTSHWISDKTGIPYTASLAGFLLIFLICFGGGGYLLAPSVAEQAEALSDSLPRAVERLEERANETPWMSRVMEQQERAREALSENVGADVVLFATGIVASVFGAITSFVIAFVIGICLSLNPGIYVRGLLKLVPRGYRDRVREVLSETGSTLQSWLIAKLLEMILIGVLTTLGLWLLGIELALVLGLIAGLLSFIPNFGPVIAVIPALLLASLEGGETMLWVAGLYLGVQAIESWGLTPWLQKRIVSMPPAVTISMQILFGLLAGTIGLILATPLAAALMVMVSMLYVEDLLGDSEGDGEQSADKESDGPTEQNSKKPA